MSTAIIQSAFVTGELSPSIFGRVDLDRYHVGASTMRNLFVSYRGGAFSRAGTAFAGYSMQTGRDFPPRLIPFQFSINQGLVLEFGNNYMRVISDGAFVTDSALSISGITQADPCVITAAATGALTATVINSNVNLSYAPKDTIGLAGGVFSSRATITVNTTQLISTSPDNPGSGYAPSDTITLTGGTFSIAAIATVVSTTVATAAIAAAGTGGTPGSAVLTGTTGTGTLFSVNATIGSDGKIASIDSIINGGNYTANPTNPAAEPVTGGGALTGATLNLGMGVAIVNVTTAGSFTKNPSGDMSQSATSGTGTGATFTANLFGPLGVTVTDPGAYTTFPSNPVQQFSTSGIGRGVEFDITTAASAAYKTGDWVSIIDVAGMVELNNETFVVTRLTSSTYSLSDVFGNPIDSRNFTPYTGGGQAARIFTLATPYAEADLKWLKFIQSADVMTLTCVNQQTLTEYQPIDLQRIQDNNWTITEVVSQSTINPPSAAHASSSSDGSTYYAYVVTAVSPDDGTESIASPAATARGVSISTQLGTNTVWWPAVKSAIEYNVYKATPSVNSAVPVGALFGFMAKAYGTSVKDNNFIPDFTTTPPYHKDPFARGQIVSANITTKGSGYDTTTTITVNTSTGSGAVLAPIVQSNGITAIQVLDGGSGYADGDTITINGIGTGATGSITIGPQSGTYPGVCSYFQQRRVFANTLNNPDTYYMSQPGSFKNFDSRIPTIDTDAIIGTPWSVQVNGVQFMLNMPGGLVIMTGLSAWQLVGAGSFATNVQPITPANQNAQPEAYNGCSSTVPPIKIDYDIIYVQAKGSIYRSLSYQFYVNVYTGIDITESSSHLFLGYTINEHAWCEEPYKVLWSVRNDGTLLSLTFNKPQQVTGWARHDTKGLFQSVTSITEPPVDALYLAVKRKLGGNWAYTIERMDDRIWSSIEDSWCVDCGLALSLPTPNSDLDVSSATGLGAISGIQNLVGGQGYSSSTYAAAFDETGDGSGATFSVTVVNGVVTAISVLTQGSGYIYPTIAIIDPENTGSGATAAAILDNSATFTAANAIFSVANVGDYIRAGGGIAVITGYTNARIVTANILSPIVDIVSDGSGAVNTQFSGSWSLATPVSGVSGLLHLAGETVTGLYDGKIIPPTTVDATGKIPLPAPATAVIVGLGFQCQLQSPYLDTGEPTIQAQRKEISAVSARLEASRDVKIGANQPDGSALSPPRIATTWDVDDVPNLVQSPYNWPVAPLYTGDVRIPVAGGFEKPGQVAIQQDNPVPMNVLAFIPEIFTGDVSEQKFPSPAAARPQRQ